MIDYWAKLMIEHDLTPAAFLSAEESDLSKEKPIFFD
jgi:hypothetical protein